MPKQRSMAAPASTEAAYAAIVNLTDAFCQQHLNDEYATLARELAAALARKRPSPLLRGKPEIWACGVIYALGTVNFLFDKTQTPYLRADELCALFGVSPSTASAKAKQIRDLFKMIPLDPRWCRPSQMDSNPMAWMVMVNGMIVDVRMMPAEVQEEAYRKGLIPYVPGHKP